MNDDFDWGRILFVVVALGIGFLQWLWNLFQQSRQRRTGDDEEPEYEDPEIRRMREEAWERQTREPSSPPPINRPPPAAQPDPWGGLRELLEEVKGPVTAETPPPQQRPTPATMRRIAPPPPPLPVVEAPPPPTRAELSMEAARLSLAFEKSSKVHVRRSGSSTDVGSGLMADLRRPEALRRAIVVREVLGPPKALQTSSDLLF